MAVRPGRPLDALGAVGSVDPGGDDRARSAEARSAAAAARSAERRSILRARSCAARRDGSR
ncbi:MAG: hypothetical protein ACJ761_05250, partial [Chloroflexota bacterium]